MNESVAVAESVDDSYARVYAALSELREGFHRSGRLDDSNAKLDEVSKLLAAYLAYRSGEIREFPEETDSHLVSALQKAFAATAALPRYRLEGGVSIFGAQSTN